MALVHRGVAVVALAGAACGRIGFGTEPVQTSVDAGPDMASILVQGREGLAPVAGAPVWSSRPDGSIEDATVSDAAGRAAVRVTAGGAISVAYPAGPPYHIRTVGDVAPGDQLAFGADLAPCDTTPRGTVAVSWPPVTGAVRYRFDVACNPVDVMAPVTSASWTVTNAVPDPADLVLRAYDGAGTPIRTATRLGVPTADGDTIAFAPSDWVVPPTAAIGFDAIPPRFTMGDLIVLFGTDADRRAGGVQGLFSAPVAGALRVDGAIAPGVTRIDASAAVSDGSPVMMQMRRGYTAPFGADLVAPITATPTIAGDIAYTAAAARVTWTRPEAGIDDAIEVGISWYDDATPVRLWKAWLPPTATDAVVPDAPPGVILGTPTSSATVGVTHVAYAARAAWSVLRQRPEWQRPGDPATGEPVTTIYTGASVVP